MMGQQVSPHTYGDAVLMSNLFKNPNERCRSFTPLLLKISFFSVILKLWIQFLLDSTRNYSNSLPHKIRSRDLAFWLDLI